MTLVRTQEEAITKIKKMMKTLAEPLDRIEVLPSGFYVFSHGRRYHAGKAERLGGKAAGYTVWNFPWVEKPEPQKVTKAKDEFPILIGHNQKKKALAILDRANNIRALSLSNNFSGEDVEKLDEKGQNWLIRDWLRFPHSRLTEESRGHYKLRYHSNDWVRFQA